jgi:hypothetical protein
MEVYFPDRNVEGRIVRIRQAVTDFPNEDALWPSIRRDLATGEALTTEQLSETAEGVRALAEFLERQVAKDAWAEEWDPLVEVLLDAGEEEEVQALYDAAHGRVSPDRLGEKVRVLERAHDLVPHEDFDRPRLGIEPEAQTRALLNDDLEQLRTRVEYPFQKGGELFPVSFPTPRASGGPTTASGSSRRTSTRCPPTWADRMPSSLRSLRTTSWKPLKQP